VARFRRMDMPEVSRRPTGHHPRFASPGPARLRRCCQSGGIEIGLGRARVKKPSFRVAQLIARMTNYFASVGFQNRTTGV
jgi:hypothetical protein